jgi:hypothetical protein
VHAQAFDKLPSTTRLRLLCGSEDLQLLGMPRFLCSPTLAANPAIPRKNMTSAMGRTMIEKRLKAYKANNWV